MGTAHLLKILFASFFVIIALFDAHADTTTGLIGWWKFNEGSGNAANDSSGRGNSGDLTGHAPDWVSGVKGGALRFNGSSQYVSGPGAPTLYSEFSFSFWVNVDVAGATTQGVGDFSSDTYIVHSGTVIPNSPRIYIKESDGNYIFLDGNSDLRDGKWHLFTVTYTGSGMLTILYIDGVQINTVVGTKATAYMWGDSQQFGRANFYWFQGSMDDVRIYSRALSAQDVYTLYLGDNRIRNATIRSLQQSN